MSAPAGPQDAARSCGYVSLCVQWQAVMESLLMFNPGQELMQGFCQEAERPLMQRRNVNQRPNLSTNGTSTLLVPGVFIGPSPSQFAFSPPLIVG